METSSKRDQGVHEHTKGETDLASPKSGTLWLSTPMRVNPDRKKTLGLVRPWSWSDSYHLLSRDTKRPLGSGAGHGYHLLLSQHVPSELNFLFKDRNPSRAEHRMRHVVVRESRIRSQEREIHLLVLALIVEGFYY